MGETEAEGEVDRMVCELIKRVPGKVSGRPIVRGTRILPDAMLYGFELGETMEELHVGYPSLSMDQIKRLIEFGLDQLKQHSIEPLKTL